MVLDHIADRSRLVIKRSAALYPKVFGHRDLHTLDIRPVPQWLQKRIRKPKRNHVMHRIFRQVVVDAKD
jgi:hypothetical protein